VDTTGSARIALYGHDTMGLGHLRRNLALARALREGPGAPDVLVATGAAEAGRFPRRDGVDLLTLPGITKDADGGYRSRRWSMPLAEVVALRSAVLTAGLLAFAPDLLVVDKVAAGFAGELEPVLRRLRAAGTRLVLGLRDVLDGPAAAAAEWRRLRTTDVLREHYDEVWVYGDRTVSDLGADCRVPPSVADLFRYTGFLAPVRVDAAAGAPPVAPGERYVLGLLGGGQDGSALARGLAATRRPAGTALVLVGGPYLPETDRAALRRAATADPGLRLVDFTPDAAAWVPGADAVVCMGGYNTVTEVLGTATPALVVPRCRPRTEQLVRARRLSDRGLVDDLHPDRLSPEVLAGWLAAAADHPRPSRAGVDLGGLARVPALAAGHVKAVRRVA
jgi:predicted glycosyltransferase